MTADPQYWYARSGDHWLARNSYGIVHWKGFAALFGIIMGGIWLLLIGVLSVVFGIPEVNHMLLKVAIAFGGALAVCLSIWLVFYAFRTLRNRVDPVNNMSHYYKKFFGKVEK